MTRYALLLLTACGGESTVTFTNNPPSVTIVAPAEGETFVSGAEFLLTAQVFDDFTPAGELQVFWQSDQIGEIDGEPSVEGDKAVSLVVTEALPPGIHEVTVRVVDGSGADATDTRRIEIVENQFPTGVFVAPTYGQLFAVGDPVRVFLQAGDADESNQNVLQLAWGGVAAMATNVPASPQSDGIAELTLTGLPEGLYDLSVQVTDPDGGTGTAITAFEVVDGDLDFDGYLDVAFGGDDCDDRDDEVHPGAIELCNGTDDDCSGAVDDHAADALTFYRDADGDGFGDEGATTSACEAPLGYVDDDADCDDLSFLVHPDADERCDGIDNDCDGKSDEDDAVDALTFHRDQDGDGFGDPTVAEAGCSRGNKWTLDDRDCDDADVHRSPDVAEECNGVDDDCDGDTDEADSLDASDWYLDLDLDGYGSPAWIVHSCDHPTEGSFVLNFRDCDDFDDEHWPGADEFCNGDDDDCDGKVDEGDALDAPVWYADADKDGYGDAAEPKYACALPAGHVADATDCDDTTSARSPNLEELCDAADLDEDCDGGAEDDDLEGAADKTPHYRDADGDGVGDADLWANRCDPGPGFEAAVSGDCNDSNENVWQELTGYADADGDGVTLATADPAVCSGVALPPKYDPVPSSEEDCNDGDDALYHWWFAYVDADFDGAGLDGTEGDVCTDGAALPSGYAELGGDCDDTTQDVQPGVPFVHPGTFTSLQDAIDHLCDGYRLEVSAGTYAEDLDFGTLDAEIIGVDGPEATFLVGTGTTVTLSGGVLDGFTVTHAQSAAGRCVEVPRLEADLELQNLVIEECDAVTGAGVRITAGDARQVTLRDVSIRSSRASTDGGGLSYVGDDAPSALGLVLDGVTLASNHADGRGGGLFLEDVWVEVDGVTLSENTADGGSSAVYASGVRGTWTDLVVDANAGPAEVALLWPREAGSLVATDWVFTGNDGSRILETVGSAGDDASFSGLTFLDNDAAEVVWLLGATHVADHAVVAGNRGDGVWLSQAPTGRQGRLEHATIAFNEGDGIVTDGDNYLEDGSVAVAYTIVVGADTGILDRAASWNLGVTYTDIYGNGAPFDGFDPTGEPGVLDVDPEFVDVSGDDPAAWDLSLDGASPLYGLGYGAL